MPRGRASRAARISRGLERPGTRGERVSCRARGEGRWDARAHRRSGTTRTSSRDPEWRQPDTWMGRGRTWYRRREISGSRETTPAFFKYFSRCERPILTSCERCERTRSRTNARIGAKDRGESRSSVMDRPSRRGASKADKAAAAASQLKSLREKGTKRLDTVEDLEDNDVYTSVRTRGTRFASPMPRMRSRERASASRTRGRIHRGRPVDRARRERGAQRAKLQIPRWCQQQGCQKKDRERTSDLTPPRPLLRDAPQMTEEEYAKFANERRQKYGGFVVGEEGDEYVPTRPDGFQIPSLPRGRSRLPLCDNAV